MRPRKCGYLWPAAAGALVMPLPAYANSSWHWFTESPLTALPWAVLGVLAAELCLICLIGRMRLTLRTAAVIGLANGISFLLPYVFIGLFPAIYSETTEFFAVIELYVRRFPHYIVGNAFLSLTLLAEMPIVCFGLCRDAENKIRLLAAALFSNAFTTLVLAYVERRMFRGSW